MASGKTINYIKLDKFDNIPTVFGDANNFHKFFEFKECKLSNR